LLIRKHVLQMNGWSNQLFQLDPEINVHTSLAMPLLVCSLNKYISLQGPMETEDCKPPLHL